MHACKMAAYDMPFQGLKLAEKRPIQMMGLKGELDDT